LLELDLELVPVVRLPSPFCTRFADDRWPKLAEVIEPILNLRLTYGYVLIGGPKVRQKARHKRRDLANLVR